MSLTNYQLATFQDAIDQVLDGVVSGDADARRQRNAARAVREAMRDLAKYRNWSYYYKRVPIATVTSQATGTLTYTHTGGSSERLVTLSGTTVTSDVENYELMISRVRYDIEKYLTATTFTLSELANPGADLAAGTSYTLERHTFPLPADFVSMGQLIDVQSPGRILAEVTMEELLLMDRTITVVNIPWCYAITAARFAGGRALRFGPTPNAARNYDAIYRRKPRELKVATEDNGNAALTSGSATVTGDGTAFSQAHVGCVIRVAADEVDPPTSPVGNLQDITNTYAFQGVVRSVEGATSLTLEQAADQTIAAGAFTISSLLDIEEGMLTAMMRLAEARMCSIEGREDWRERQEDAAESLMAAAEADNTSFPSSGQVKVPIRLGDWATSFSRTLSSG